MRVSEAAVAHRLGPFSPATSSDALRPDPLAASSGTASACMLKRVRLDCEARL